MNYNKLISLQREYGYDYYQSIINSGDGWKLEGSVGRYLMSLLECGACMLPTKSTTDYYGNYIPSRNELKPGTKGSYQNCKRFWSKVESGEIYLHVEEDEEIEQ